MEEKILIFLDSIIDFSQQIMKIFAILIFVILAGVVLFWIGFTIWGFITCYLPERKKYKKTNKKKTKNIYFNLFVAIKYNDIFEIKKLLTQNIDLNTKNNIEQTPLMAACNLHTANIEIIKLLLEHNADPYIQNEGGETALMLACNSPGNIEIIKLLLEYKADPNIQEQEGFTALMYLDCEEKPNIEIIKLLLEKGANPNIQNDEGSTALTRFSYSKTPNIEIIKLLLEYETNPNIQDIDGDTALIRASYSKTPNTKIIKLLLDFNADPNIKNKDGYTALDIAKNNENKKLASFLRNYSSKKTNTEQKKEKISITEQEVTNLPLAKDIKILIKEFGNNIFNEGKKFESAIKDLCIDSALIKDRNLIIMLLNMGLGKELIAIQNKSEEEKNRILNLKYHELINNYGFQKEKSMTILLTLATALDWNNIKIKK